MSTPGGASPGRDRPPLHPGEVLRQQYLLPRHITQAEFARRLKIPEQTLSAIIHGRHRITPRLAFRLAAELRTAPQLWMHLQVDWDLWSELLQRGNNGHRASQDGRDQPPAEAE